MPEWIWQRNKWPQFSWDEAAIATPLARARLAHGRVLGAVGILDPALTREAYAAFLVGEGVARSAIEGERLNVNAVRSSVARHSLHRRRQTGCAAGKPLCSPRGSPVSGEFERAIFGAALRCALYPRAAAASVCTSSLRRGSV